MKNCQQSVTHRTGGSPTTQCGNRALPDSDYCHVHDSRTSGRVKEKARTRDFAKSALRSARQACRHAGEKQSRAAYFETRGVQDEEWLTLGHKLVEAEAKCRQLGIEPSSVGW